MKIALLTPPWGLPWIEGLKQMAVTMGHELTVMEEAPPHVDVHVIIHGWAGLNLPQAYPHAINMVFVRRFERFAGDLMSIDWRKVDHLIFVNDWISDTTQKILVKEGIHFSIPTSVIYNAVEPLKWTYKPNRPRSHRIGMACYVNQKKNLPMALQILLGLPEDYELHIAGQVQDPCTAEYLNHVAKYYKRKVYI